jgi:hypothetical protein
VLETVAMGVADGVAKAAGVGSATEPGNSVSGVKAAIGPAVGDELATTGVGMGVGGAAYWEVETVIAELAPPVGVGLGLGATFGAVVFGRM